MVDLECNKVLQTRAHSPSVIPFISHGLGRFPLRGEAMESPLPLSLCHIVPGGKCGVICSEDTLYTDLNVFNPSPNQYFDTTKRHVFISGATSITIHHDARTTEKVIECCRCHPPPPSLIPSSLPRSLSPSSFECFQSRMKDSSPNSPIAVAIADLGDSRRFARRSLVR